MTPGTTTHLPATQTLILAGGQGERLLPLTRNRPKPAIPFGGVFRIIDFTLSNCLHSKLEHVALLTQYRHEELNSYVRTGWSGLWNHAARNAQPLLCVPPSTGKRYKGTADAVFQNLELIERTRSEYVLVLSGDHVYHMDYRELLAQHMEMQADVTIATIEYPLKHASQFGVVEVDKDFRVTGFEEKPENPRPLPLRRERALISMGVYAFKTRVLLASLKENCELRRGYDFGHHIIPSLISSARAYAYDFRDEHHDAPRYWRDIGTVDSYYRANMDLVRPDSGFNPYVNPYETTHVTHHPTVAENKETLGARVHTDCHVSHTVLSPGVQIEEGANVHRSVLMTGAHIGRGAAVRNAIVEEGVDIPADSRIGWDVNEDRQRYVVSPTGVVVVSETPNNRQTVVCSPHHSVSRRDAMRVVA
jgi:glucose-1-phosphate adenylyltransferase